jgi:TonB-linked SusC/RagA family outer membrane protein
MKKTILFIVLATLCFFLRVSGQDINSPGHILTGVVTDELGHTMPGATVKLSQSDQGVTADKNGIFALSNIPLTGKLAISFIGYQTLELSYDLRSQQSLNITLKADANSLNEVQVIGYGTTTKRLNTGSVSTVTAESIAKQPVTNVLSALEGQVAGLNVQTSNGLPGGNISVNIRGQGSITAGTNPLYIIDGIPFSSTIVSSTSTLAASSINGAESPFNSINPADIESITVLKDADATSIYGSRGANGVILITTKKGKAGKTKTDITISQGTNQVANLPSLLNLQQYLMIRNEAFKNDGLTPSADPNSPAYAPDLKVWDTTKSTNWPKYLLGNTGHVTDGQGSVSGGNNNTTFVIGGNFHSETTILPGDNLYQRGGIHATIQHTSLNNKFFIQLTNSFTIDNNQLANPANGISGDLLLPPDYPIYNSSGNLNWTAGANPAADLLATSKIQTENLVTNLLLKYTVAPDLDVKVSTGINKINIDQVETFPTASLYPGSINYSNFGNNSNQTFIIEPQIDYTKNFGSSHLNVLAGGTYQYSLAQGQLVVAQGFSSEGLLDDLGSASSYSASNSYDQYKYESVFGRATYSLSDKYIVNASIRRDGSSRFGPDNRFGNFGAVGAAWLFGSESFIKTNIPFLSYGKLRASYGLTGNDQIADYQYLSTYGSSYNIYQGISALQPSIIANNDFHWEVTKKLDYAVELGFLKDHILLTVDRYINRSSDQLVAYAIPTITGFSSYEANLPAVIVNSGWEFELNTVNLKSSNFKWTTNFNFTVPKNELQSFQDFSSSAYAQTLRLGYDITRVTGVKFLGVNPATGYASYAPQPGSSSTDPYFYYTEGKLTPDFYGGIGNTISYKNWSFDIFGQFNKHMLPGGIVYTPGTLDNNYSIALSRWQKPGDVTNMPRASTTDDFYYSYSSANFVNASYFRIKNIALSYTLPAQWLKKANVDRLRIYLQGQNVFTFWNKNSTLFDPESGAISAGAANIPPLKSFVAGFEITL